MLKNILIQSADIVGVRITVEGGGFVQLQMLLLHQDFDFGKLLPVHILYQGRMLRFLEEGTEISRRNPQIACYLFLGDGLVDVEADIVLGLLDIVTAALQKENSGLGVDLCFEASGAPQAVVQGMDVLRNRGVYLVPGQYSASGGITIQPQTITFKALHIIGSSQYSVIDVEQYLNFLIANKDLHPLIDKMSSKYPIERINEAIADAKSGSNIKTLLV